MKNRLPDRIVLVITILSTCMALDIPWSLFTDSHPFLRRRALTHPSKTSSLRPYHHSRWIFFVSTAVVDGNSSNPLVEWEFISHLIITPEQCDAIANVVQTLDEALQRANPDVKNVSSTAFRLGNQDCVDGQCSCKKAHDMHRRGRRRVLITHLLLEVKTRSPDQHLKPPLQLPVARHEQGPRYDS